MKTALTVLLAVAAELSKLAKDSLPKMREGEKLCREWYKNGIYHRESALNGRIFIAEYDFRQRKCRFWSDEDVISDNRYAEMERAFLPKVKCTRPRLRLFSLKLVANLSYHKRIDLTVMSQYS